MTSIESITAVGVIPVLVLDDVAMAQPVGAALRDGGLPLAEVTLRTPASLDALREMRQVDGMVVGAGTVTTADQVDRAVEAGARFIVSPGLSESVVRRAQALDVPVVPGVVTPTEVMRALDLGVDVLKFFPAEASGGVPAVAALAGPFRGVRFIPTGGITAESASGYLALPNVVAVGGSWIAPAELVAVGGLDQIRSRARAASALCQNLAIQRF